MIRTVQLQLKWRRRVQRRGPITFAPGLNTLVGPNGSGKSTVIRALVAAEAGDGEVEFEGSSDRRLFDTETMNPRVDRSAVGTREAMTLRIRGRFSSHGQMLRQALANLAVSPGATILLDEPEAGQDFDTVRQIKRLVEGACERGYQVIAASHHPVFWHDTNLVEMQSGYVDEVSRQMVALLSDQYSSVPPTSSA